MRPLSEEETKMVFEKLYKFVGKDIKSMIERPDGRYCLRLHKNRVYYVSEALMKKATNIARDKLVGLGTPVGKLTHSGKFRLTIGALDVLARYAKHKVWLKPSAEMQYLYGNHVLKSGLGRITESTPAYAGVVVYSMADVPLGFGLTAKSTNEARGMEPSGIVVLHQADVGEYLRAEDELDLAARRTRLSAAQAAHGSAITGAITHLTAMRAWAAGGPAGVTCRRAAGACAAVPPPGRSGPASACCCVRPSEQQQCRQRAAAAAATAVAVALHAALLGAPALAAAPPPPQQQPGAPAPERQLEQRRHAAARGAGLPAAPSPLGDIGGLFDDAADPFTLYGTTFKQFQIEKMQGEKVVSRARGFTVDSCVSAVQASAETPEFNGLATGQKVQAGDNLLCKRATGQDLKASCKASCGAACTDALAGYEERLFAESGLRLDDKERARVLRNCRHSCSYECTKSGKAHDFVVPSRR
ncbi:nip7 [Scenedesmus sp. PABB004]|nr:nip7 [Scenedesmus sp. PABB004]